MNLCSVVVQLAEILQNQPIILPGKLQMFSGIDRFDVKKKQIDKRKNRFILFPCSKTAGFQTNVQSGFMCQPEQGMQKVKLHHRFTSGERHASSGVLVENAVLPDFGHNLFDRKGTPAEFQRFGRTQFDTLAASDASRAVELMTPVRRERMNPRGADLRAAAASGAFGGGDLPRPGAVIMQYTGLNEYSESDPPTYACVGDRDNIANWRIMQARLSAMQKIGIDTEFHVYPGLGHGFGLGIGTIAEGWMNDAAAFWEKQMKF